MEASNEVGVICMFCYMLVSVHPWYCILCVSSITGWLDCSHAGII